MQSECLRRGPEGIERLRVDIAGRMIQWIERHATPEFCLKIGGGIIAIVIPP